MDKHRPEAIHEAPKREPEVTSAMGRIEFGLEQLDASIETLAEKISSVMRQESAVRSKEADEPPPPATAQLAVQLNALANRIRLAQARMMELCWLVEL